MQSAPVNHTSQLCHTTEILLKPPWKRLELLFLISKIEMKLKLKKNIQIYVSCPPNLGTEVVCFLIINIRKVADLTLEPMAA